MTSDHLLLRPRIAIPVPTSADPAYNQRCQSAYFHAIESSGGLPVAVPLLAEDEERRSIFSTCDGVLLPGSPADYRPERYGQDAEEATAHADVPRENTDGALLRDAEYLRKPVLGVCYGLQSLNVWLGGTLLQDVAILPINHSAGPAVAIAHTVALHPQSRLALLVGGGDRVEGYLRVPVNSSHHQAVGVPGDGLRVVARCPQDGVVEAIESEDGRMVGVQWHPERSYAESVFSRKLFDWLVLEAAKRVQG